MTRLSAAITLALLAGGPGEAETDRALDKEPHAAFQFFFALENSYPY